MMTIVLPADGLQKVHPSRGLNVPKIKVDTKKNWVSIRKKWKPDWEAIIGETTGDARSLLLQVQARAESDAAPTDAKIEGLLQLVLLQPDYQKTALIEMLTDYQVWMVGLRFTLDALLESLNYGWVYGSSAHFLSDTYTPDGREEHFAAGFLGAFFRLRQHLAAASEADYAQALAHATGRFSSLTPLQMAALAYVFPDADFAEQIATTTLWACVVCSLKDGAATEQLIQRLGPETFPIRVLDWSNDLEGLGWTLLARQGMAAVPALLALLKVDREALGPVLSAIPDTRVIAGIFEDLEDMSLVQEMVERYPLLCFEPLAKLAAGRSKFSSYASVLLTKVLLRDDGSLPARTEKSPMQPKNWCKEFFSGCVLHGRLRLSCCRGCCVIRLGCVFKSPVRRQKLLLSI